MTKFFTESCHSPESQNGCSTEPHRAKMVVPWNPMGQNLDLIKYPPITKRICYYI